MKLKLKYSLLIITIIFSWLSSFYPALVRAEMPFYYLQPQEIVLRAEFFTTYSSSQEERKNNIYLATKSLNNTLVDVGGEFSFNKTVGERTEKRGYKTAKIIFNGKFIDGVGGGVCQVSSTLYNAVLLAGLKVIEVHPHSLPVGYVAPSFDAMVNSATADLRFVNNTYNPIIIKAIADGDRVKIQIYGEKMNYVIQRKSEITSIIPAPTEDVLIDEKGEYPDLCEGEERVILYSKEGLNSEGYIIKKANGKAEKIRIRKDKYNPLRGLIIRGKAKKETPPEEVEFLSN